MHDLALQVGEVDLSPSQTVMRPTPLERGTERGEPGRPRRRRAHGRRGGAPALLAELVQQQVTAITESLAIVHYALEGRPYFVMAAVVVTAPMIGRP